MSVRRTTMQDIADACGLSRNTISKVFNGRGSVPEVTRRAVLEKAQELGYRQLPAEKAAPQRQAMRSVALFTNHMPERSHYGSVFVSAFTNRLSRAGYTLMMYEILPEELRERRLPANFVLEQTAGLLGIELFDRGYSDFVCSLGLPTIFADTCAHTDFSALAADVISMENIDSTAAVTEALIRAGAARLGFVGDREHCNSFFQRWQGFCLGLARAGLAPDESLCLLADDKLPYGDTAWLLQQLARMPRLPDAFVCANDYLATHLMAALRQKGLHIPDDVMVAGFDGSPESAIIEPPLTTVRIPSADMGAMAAGILLDRIQNPALPYRCTYVQSLPIWRSTIRPAPSKTV